MEERRQHQDRRRSDRYGSFDSELYVAFRCAEYHFVFEKQEVMAITPLPNIISLPLSHHWFVGVTSISGYIACVTDLSAYLNLEPAITKEGAKLILTAHGDNVFGLVVDSIVGVIECQSCERSRAIYPIEIETFTSRQRCNGDQCYDEFDIRRLYLDPKFQNAVTLTSHSS